MQISLDGTTGLWVAFEDGQPQADRTVLVCGESIVTLVETRVTPQGIGFFIPGMTEPVGFVHEQTDKHSSFKVLSHWAYIELPQGEGQYP